MSSPAIQSTQRRVLLLLHPKREQARVAALEIARGLASSGIAVEHHLSSEGSGVPEITRYSGRPINEFELIIVLGGDGTMLRSAEISYGISIPILGINVGHMGFLAEVERPANDQIIEAVVKGQFVYEERMSISFEIERHGETVDSGWALNEIVIEKESSQMVELFVSVDQRPLSLWNCDGVLCATPTGSTAYAFSAGGPVVWPDVDALVLLPLAAHALFARPMVLSPRSEIAISVRSENATLSADGFRHKSLLEGDLIRITRDSHIFTLARMTSAPFANRLVAKFQLPVVGWRGE
ncbi:MAG: NAD kinase [Actinobacteria bacterium]|uniref:NAD kinase n=1 Tax=Candidatus Fonsibacter lacus TaxID=2576439 RepID=A0A965LKR1_9PROT|nr:NAD kinase [Candidatus Fonsibacter lacus]